ncbi:MAG: alpha/beta hydrolase [Cyanobacteria bacterium J06642_2]
MSAVKLGLGSLVLLPALGYAALLILLYVAQSRLIFRPSTVIAATPADINLPYEQLSLETADGVDITAWYIPAPASDPQNEIVMLFCHGNAGNISSRLDYLAIFHGLGLATLTFDYRGYGSSEGQPSEEGTYRDADAVWNYLTDSRGIAARHIVLYGESLGGGVASYMAQRYQPGALILASTFTSLGDRALELYPFVPVNWLLKTKYESRDRLADVASPVLVIHSPDDEVIPFSHGLALHEAAKPPKQFLKITGSHNSGYADSLPTYQAGLKDFIETTFALKPAPGTR